MYRGVVVVIHTRSLIVQTQARRKAPTPRTQRRLVIEGQTVGRDLEVARYVERALLDHKLGPRHYALYAGICSPENQIADTVLEEGYGSLHTQTLVETVGACDPLPAAAVVIAAQHDILSQGVLALLLHERK